MPSPRGLSKLIAGVGVIALVSVFVVVSLMPLSADQPVATPDNPAVITAEPATAPPGTRGPTVRDLTLTPSPTEQTEQAPDAQPPAAAQAPADQAPPDQAPDGQPPPDEPAARMQSAEPPSAAQAPPPSDQPATAQAPEGAPDDQSTYVSIGVMSYTPPTKGRVEAVVKMDHPVTGETREIGRFGFYPNMPFKAGTPEEAQRFMFKIEGAAVEEGDQPQITVELVPAPGQMAEGARLELGKATIVTAALKPIEDKPVATPGSPALVTTEPAPPPPAGTSSQDGGPDATYVAVAVTGYTPPKKGTVQAVVMVYGPNSKGPEEIGRFAMFPNSEFHVENPLDAQRFMFKVDPSVLDTKGQWQPRVLVDLVPSGNSKGEGASMKIGKALIEER